MYVVCPECLNALYEVVKYIFDQTFEILAKVSTFRVQHFPCSYILKCTNWLTIAGPMMERDKFMNSEEAKKLGLIDTVVTSPPKATISLESSPSTS